MTPEEEAAVSRLLAESAEPVTMPASVSARLDDVLTELVAERTGSHAPQTLGEVIPIRQRRWPRVLLAAAAVTVFGYVGAGLIRPSGSDDAASTDTAGSVQESVPSPSYLDGRSAREDAAGGPEALPESSPDDLKGVTHESLLDLIPSSGANAVTTCPTPTVPGASAYQKSVKDQSLVVVVNKLGGNAARADIDPCGQTVFPVASRLLLDAR